MSSETGNAKAQKEQQGSSNPNIELQKAQSRDPDKSNARDRENRKGGDNAKNI